MSEVSDYTPLVRARFMGHMGIPLSFTRLAFQNKSSFNTSLFIETWECQVGAELINVWICLDMSREPFLTQLPRELIFPQTLAMVFTWNIFNLDTKILSISNEKLSILLEVADIVPAEVSRTTPNQVILWTGFQWHLSSLYWQKSEF
jgi:hypothetical protein